MSYKCKECGAEFETEKGLHVHLRTHKMYMADYYVKHYPRYNKLNNTLLPFKNKEDYFNNDFFNRKQLIKWCETAPQKEVKDYIRFIGNRRLVQLGLEPIYDVQKNPLGWLDTMLNAVEHMNFFEGRATEYSKASTQGTWVEAFS